MRLSTVCWSKSLYRKMHPRSRFPAFFWSTRLWNDDSWVSCCSSVFQVGSLVKQTLMKRTKQREVVNMAWSWSMTIPSLKLTSEFTPENWWLGDDPFLLGPGLFSAAFAVGLRDGSGDAQIFTDICKASGLGMKSLLKSRLHEHWWMFFGYEILPFFKDQLKI